MLRVVDHWFASDVGRQRQGNEDNLFVQSPLFVVADGMGGAQAGEVASQMAVEAFHGGMPNGAPDQALIGIINKANQRIHDHSRADSSHHGMGTTVTAAYVTEDDVVIAHVGDSRAYLLRDGELTRLTRDHSLVGELVDRGKLTEEEAEIHPQRSVITRALGPEREVQVDTERIAARPGDVFLLCSDGLTSMVREPGLKPVLTEAPTLEEAGRRLIAAANEAGGRDNITVILFRLGEVAGGARAEQATAEQGDGYDDFQATVPPAEQPTRAGEGAPATADVAAAVRAADDAQRGRASDDAEAEYRRHGTVAMSTVAPPRTQDESAPPPRTAPLPPRPPASAAPPRKRRRRFPAGLVVVAVIGALVLGGLWIATRAVYFVGTDEGTVTIYRGVPYDLPLGLELYERYYRSGVTIEQVPGSRRETFTDHKLRSLDDAENLVRALEQGRLSP